MSEVLEIRTVPLTAVRPNPKNIRADLGDVETLANDIKAFGVLEPLKVCAHPDIKGDYLILDGHRRRAAAESVSIAEVPVLVRDLPTDIEQLEIMLSTGGTSKALTPVEVAKGVQGLLDLGESAVKIAKRWKLPLEEVQGRIAAAKAPKTVQAGLNSYSLSFTDLAALEKAKEEHPEAAEKFDATLEDWITRNREVDSKRIIAQVVVESNRDKLIAECEQAGAVTLPSSDRWSGAWTVTHAELTTQEHVDAGHRPSVAYSGEVEWFEPNPNHKKPTAKEAKPETVALKKQLRALDKDLEIERRTRSQHLAEKCFAPSLAQKSLMAPEVAYLLEEVVMNEFTHKAQGWFVEHGLITVESEFLKDEWRTDRNTFRKYLSKLDLTQLVRVRHFLVHLDDDWALRRSEGFNPDVAIAGSRYRWVEDLANFFGWEPTPATLDAVRIWSKLHPNIIAEGILGPAEDGGDDD